MTKLTIDSKLPLKSGYEIPILGFGVYQTPASECEAAVAHALKTGYRHIDSAVAYRNQEPCGAAIRASNIPRPEIFFTSKISPSQLSYENTKGQVNTTLQMTGLEYIDLMLLHSPYGGRESRKGAWKALVEAQLEGKIRSLGVSNFGVHHLDEMEDFMQELEQEHGKGRGGAIDVGQWEVHPWLGRSDIVAWCQQRNIVVEAYSPLVRGQRMEEKVLQPLMNKYAKSAAQILLRWNLQKGYVPLPKSVTPSRIKENAQVFDFELSQKEMDSLTTNEYSPCTWDPTVSKLED